MSALCISGNLFFVFFLFFLIKDSDAHDCNGFTFKVYRGRQMYYKTESRPGQTWAQCLHMCETFSWCKSVEYDRWTHNCKLYEHTGIAVKDMCCYVAIKTCARDYQRPQGKQANSVERKTTTMETTTVPNTPTPTTQEEAKSTNPPTMETTTMPLFGQKATSRSDNSPDWNIKDLLSDNYDIDETARLLLYRVNNGLSGVSIKQEGSQVDQQPDSRQGEGERRTTPPNLQGLFLNARDDGICPSLLQKVEDTFVPNGTGWFSVENVNQCKQVCLNDETCEAVNYNRQFQICYLRDRDSMVDYDRRYTPCCDQYHKTHCEPKRCYMHGEIDVSYAYDETIENIKLGEGQVHQGVKAQQCSGICFIEEVIQVTPDGSQLEFRSLERGCLEGLTVSDVHPCSIYEERGDEGGVTLRVRCKCSTDHCNALATGALIGIALYLPLDGDTEDHSGIMRHGENEGVQFDAYAKKKGMSGYFDGTSNIMVPSMVGYLPGLLTYYDNERTPSLTMTFWFKRLFHTYEGTNAMTLFSNGVVEVSSKMEEGIHTVSLSVILENGVGYVVKGQIADAEDWVFVVARLILGPTPEGAQLQLFLSDTEIDTDAPNISIGLPPEPVMSSIFPVYIGRHPLKKSYFHGFIDEVFLFSESLGVEHIQALRDMTKPLPDDLLQDTST